MTESADESLAKALGQDISGTEHQWKRNEYDDEIDIFGFENGYHNGPMCVRCFESYCYHCDDGPEEKECKPNIPPYTTSFDACLRDIVPVLAARGIGTAITLLPGGFAIVQMFDRNADRNHEEPDYIVDIGPKPLLAAFCEAALGALEASND